MGALEDLSLHAFSILNMGSFGALWRNRQHTLVAFQLPLGTLRARTGMLVAAAAWDGESPIRTFTIHWLCGAELTVPIHTLWATTD